MKKWGRVETGVILTISMFHMPSEALDTLNGYYAERALDLGEDHWARNMSWLRHEFGFGASARSLDRYAASVTEMPPFLSEARELAADFGAEWILFDRDADVVEGMTQYEDTY